MAEPAVAPARAPATDERRPGAAPSRRTIPAPVGVPPAVGTLNLSGPGEPVPRAVAEPVSRSLGVDLSHVRVHSDSRAAGAVAAVGARAFAYGNRVFLGHGERASDLALMAHELAHMVQQRGAARLQRFRARTGGDRFEREAHQASAAVVRGESATVAERTPPLVQRLGLSDALDFFADKANLLPGFRMFTIVLGVNPINQHRVDRSPANILRALIEFIPGGRLITQAMAAYGVFDRVGAWVERQVAALGIAGATVRQALDRFLDGLSWSDILDLGAVWERAKRIFTGLIDRLFTFARDIVTGIVDLIKDAILRPLAEWAKGTRGWGLLTAVLGRDPITGDPVPRTAESLIGGFMKLIGRDEVWEDIKRANAIPRAWAWFQTTLEALLGFVRQVPAMFVAALRSLTVEDILLIPRAFSKVAHAFGDFVLTFVGWAGKHVLGLLQIIFEVVAPGAMPYLRKAMGAFNTIIADPVRFIGHLVKAGVQGFKQFASNFLAHLRAALIGWLTGTLGGTGIYIPQAFNLREIVKFVLSVLGLTWENVRGKLVKAVGETTVRVFETGVEIVATLVREGPGAAWEKLVEHLANLRQMVIDGVMDFVKEKIVVAAITRLVSMLNPVGAFVQAVIAIYNTVMFFLERLEQIAAVAKSVIDSIAAIAAGAIGAAANRVEQTMGGLLTLVISFLARLVGLGRVSDAVKRIIDRVRAPIDKALDKVVAWIVTLGRRLVGAATGTARAAVQRVRGWLGLRQRFTADDGSQHSLYFERRGDVTQLIRASDLPTEVRAFINANFPPGHAKRAVAGQAMALVGEINLITRTADHPEVNAPGNTTARQEAAIGDKVSRLSRLMAKLVEVDSVTMADLPERAEWLSSASDAADRYSTVALLSSKTARGGSGADGMSPEYALTVGAGWVRMHLLPYSVGGKGSPDNWIAAPQNVNTSAAVRNSFEASLERAVRSATVPTGPGMHGRDRRGTQANVVWAEARVAEFYPTIKDARDRAVRIAKRVSLRFGIYGRRPGPPPAWQRIDAPVSAQMVPIPGAPDNRIHLSHSSGTAMRESGLPHLSHAVYGARLVDIIKEVRGSALGSYAVLESRLKAATANARLPGIDTPQSIEGIVADLRANEKVAL